MALQRALAHAKLGTSVPLQTLKSSTLTFFRSQLDKTLLSLRVDFSSPGPNDVNNGMLDFGTNGPPMRSQRTGSVIIKN